MGYIVCGWYTPDYVDWKNKLAANLERLNIPHDFAAVPCLDGNWEGRTLRKACEVRSAMDRHPDKVIVFLDVDCEVRGPLDRLAHTGADVAVFMRIKRRSDGTVRCNVRSGTLVISPTEGARELIDAWVDETEHAEWGDNDQNTLMLAMAKAPNCLLSFISPIYCAVRADGLRDPIVFHDSASKNARKIGRTQRRLRKVLKLLRAA